MRPSISRDTPTTAVGKTGKKPTKLEERLKYYGNSSENRMNRMEMCSSSSKKNSDSWETNSTKNRGNLKYSSRKSRDSDSELSDYLEVRGKESYNSRRHERGSRRRFLSSSSDSMVNGEVLDTSSHLSAPMTSSKYQLQSNTAVSDFNRRDSSDESMHTMKKRSSESGEWMVSELMKNKCFDERTGVLLSKNNCLTNLKTAMKSKKPADFYEVLKMKNRCQPGSVLEELVLQTSFCLYTLGRQQRGKELEEHAAKAAHPFNLLDAKTRDEPVQLPGGQKILISSLLTSAMCSGFTGKSAIEKCIGSILREIEKLDKFFIVYSVPKSCRNSKYPLISQDFFEKFAVVIKDGFSLEDTDLTNIANLVKDSMTNFIGRRRGKNKEKSAELFEEFQRLHGFPQKMNSVEPICDENQIDPVEEASPLAEEVTVPVKRTTRKRKNQV